MEGREQDLKHLKNMQEQTIQIMRHKKGKKRGGNRILASWQ
jgi:hypothetical protein